MSSQNPEPRDDQPLRTSRVLSPWLPEIPPRPLDATYQLTDRLLGSGGCGSVVVARKRHLPQEVAIKRIHRSQQIDKSAQRQFVREVKSLALLQHPNIVRVEDWGRDEQGLYIVMELINGPTLLDVLKKHGGPLPLPQVVDYGLQVCLALECAHRNGIVHRDLKPENLLLDPHGVVKLVDFGLARRDPRLGDSSFGTAGSKEYTTWYASPEQLENRPEIDSRTDLYSLAVTLYYLATGRSPGMWAPESEAAPAPLRPLLSKLLVDVKDRLKDIAEVQKALQGITATTPRLVSAAELSEAALQSARKSGCCWKCGSEDSTDRKYCADCGTSLSDPCLSAACGTAIGVWEAYCPNCGADQTALRRTLQQQTTELCQTVQQQLSQQRFDLASVTLKTAQDLLPTIRLRQLQPELPQLAAEIDRQQQSVQLVLDNSRQLGEACKYSEALKCLQAIPQPLWPEAAVQWRNRESEVQRLREQMSQPALKFSWDELSHWLQQLQQLQPNGLFQCYVGRWLQDYQSAAEGLDRAGRWDEVVTLLSGVPEDERTPVMVQLLQQIEQRVAEVCGAAAELASGGDYAEAVKRLQQLPQGLRPAVLGEYRSRAKEVQNLRRQLNLAIDAEQLSKAVQCVGTLEGLQPGRWLLDSRLRQLREHLLTRCEEFLQLEQLDAAWSVLQEIPADLQTVRYRVAMQKYERQLAIRAPRYPTFPFTAAEAMSAQSAWAKHLGCAEEWTNTLGMRFRVIPAGTFLMRRPNVQGSHDERQHKVKIEKSFGLGVHSVTQGQWQQLMGNTPWKGGCYVNEGSDIAATYVSWADASLFCRKLSSADGRRYRLPTEAEWEWSCRAGTTTAYSFGDDKEQLEKHAWYLYARKGMHAHLTGRKSANPFGLHDMHGNVWEWCEDRCDSGHSAKSAATDPAGPNAGFSRALRGGSWCLEAESLCSASRSENNSNVVRSDIGFRVLCELE